MFTIKAKYNSANVMLPDEGHIDDTTKTQIYGFLNHPAFGNSYIAIMPDCHAGAGSCIGFTMKMNDYIIPNIVGVDIGCGVLSANVGKTKIDLQKFDDFIRGNIPSGFNVNSKSQIDNTPFKDTVLKLSKKIGSDPARNVLACGSLGGGNHFIEIGVDENEDKWITVHTGSRKFGLDICNYHQNIAKGLMKKMFIGSAYHKMEFLTDGYKEDYLKDMEIAQNFAERSRDLIITKLVDFIGVKEKSVVESTHNFIDFQDNIVRKGAIRAYENESLIIPFNMQDGLIIGEGKSNPKWNYSAPHGAGRVLSRRKAKETLDIKDMKEGMKRAGVFTTSLSKNTLDEAKGAYKNKHLILNAIKETVDIKHFVKPIYNFKSES